MYFSYTAATFARKHELAAKQGVNLEGAVTWAFEFENQPFFDGFRDLATIGIDKPVLNVFRMFGMMSGQRLPVQSSGTLPLADMVKSGVKAQAGINAVAPSVRNEPSTSWLGTITTTTSSQPRQR